MIVNFCYVALDTETSGLNEATSAVLEIAMCPFDSELNNLEEYVSPIIAPYNPSLEYTTGALQVNGLSMDQINKGKLAKEVFEEIVTYLAKLKKGKDRPVLIAHNRKFDVGFMSEFFKFFKKDFNDYINTEYPIDTMWWGRTRWIESTNYKLGTLVSNAGLETDSQHRALSDARVTRDLAKYFITNLRSEGTGIQGERYRNKFEF